MASSPTKAPPGPADLSFGFADLSELKAAHSRLVQDQAAGAAADTPSREFLDAVDAFIIRAADTGHVIDDEDDRVAVQSIIDYWGTVLMRARRPVPAGSLAEFGRVRTSRTVREMPVRDYLVEERSVIRRRLGLCAAATQWDASKRDSRLLWGGPQLHEAQRYQDLTDIERKFIDASLAEEKRLARLKRAAWIVAVLVVVAGIVGILLHFFLQNRAVRHQLARQYTQLAANRMSSGDVAGSLLWLVEALREDNKDCEQLHRLQLGSAISQLPKLYRLFAEPDDEYLNADAKFNADGSYILTVANNKAATRGMVRIWKVDSGELVRTIPHDDGPVNFACFGPHGEVLTASGVQGQSQGQARLWKAGPEQPLKIQPIGGPASFAVISPGGERIAIISEQPDAKTSNVRIWQTAHPDRPITEPLRVDEFVTHAAFSPDGNYLVASGKLRGRGVAHVWNAWTGDLISTSPNHDLPIKMAAFSPDSRAVVTASGRPRTERGEVQVWDSMSGSIRFRGEHTNQVVSVCFSPDGRRVLSASYDGSAKLWNAETGALLFTVRHESSVYGGVFSPDGRHFVTSGRDRTARVWDVMSGELAFPPLNDTGTAISPTFSPDGRLVLASSYDGARLWQLATGEPITPSLRTEETVEYAAISSDQSLVAFASRSGELGTWKPPGPEITLSKTEYHVDAAFFSADAKRVLLVKRVVDQPAPGSSAEGTARLSRYIAQVWDTITGKQIGKEFTDELDVNYAAFSSDNKYVIISRRARTLRSGGTRIYDVTTSEPVGGTLEVQGNVNYASFTSDNQYVLTAGGSLAPRSGEARVWEVTTGSPATPPLKHNEEVLSAAFNQKLTRIATASTDDTAKIWEVDLPTRQAREAMVLAEHTADLILASFSPDGTKIVTASYDRTAVLWNADTGRRLAVLSHPGRISDAGFAPEGSLLVTACSDGTARVWDTSTADIGEFVAAFPHRGEVRKAVFSAGGSSLITLSAYQPTKRVSPERDSISNSSDTTKTTTIPTQIRAQVWAFKRADEKINTLRDFAQLIYGRALDKGGRDYTLLDRKELRAIWGKLHETYMPRFVGDQSKVSEEYAADESQANGQWFAARWHLDRLLAEKPRDALLLARRGFISSQLNKWDDAISDYTHAYELDPSNSEYLMRRAIINAQLRRWDPVKQDMENTVNLAAGKNPELERRARMLRAEAHAATRDWDKAADDLSKAIDLNPGLPSGYQRLAVVRLRQGDQYGYRATCQEMLQRFSDADFGTPAWAAALAPNAVRDYTTALQVAMRAVEKTPDNYFALNTLGAAQFRAGKYEEAVVTLGKSRKAYTEAASRAHMLGTADATSMPITDGRPLDWLFLAMSHHRLNHDPEANSAFEKIKPALDKEFARDPRGLWSTIEFEMLREEVQKVFVGDPLTGKAEGN